MQKYKSMELNKEKSFTTNKKKKNFLSFLFINNLEIIEIFQKKKKNSFSLIL